jgi:hypothetical protein
METILKIITVGAMAVILVFALVWEILWLTGRPTRAMRRLANRARAVGSNSWRSPLLLGRDPGSLSDRAGSTDCGAGGGGDAGGSCG